MSDDCVFQGSFMYSRLKFELFKKTENTENTRSLESTMQSTVRNIIYCFAWLDPKNVFFPSLYKVLCKYLKHIMAWFLCKVLYMLFEK